MVGLLSFCSVSLLCCLSICMYFYPFCLLDGQPCDYTEGLSCFYLENICFHWLTLEALVSMLHVLYIGVLNLFVLSLKSYWMEAILVDMSGIN